MHMDGNVLSLTACDRSLSGVLAKSKVCRLRMQITQSREMHKIENAQCNLEIAQILRLHGTYIYIYRYFDSLVPRLPCSGTRTLKLCRLGEPGTFFHMRSGKGREEVEITSLTVNVRTHDSEQEKEQR